VAVARTDEVFGTRRVGQGPFAAPDWWRCPGTLWLPAGVAHGGRLTAAAEPHDALFGPRCLSRFGAFEIMLRRTKDRAGLVEAEKIHEQDELVLNVG
jgi:hypothetical protein